MNMEQLAQELARHPNFRWELGMLAWWNTGEEWGRFEEDDVGEEYFSSMVPDLTDSATLGCLVALVRELWDNPRLVAAPTSHENNEGRKWAVGWLIDIGTILYFQKAAPGEYDTEAKALARAIMAAPRKETDDDR